MILPLEIKIYLAWQFFNRGVLFQNHLDLQEG